MDNGKKAALISYLASKGIIGADAEAEIASMAKSVSDVDIAELGLVDDIDKAYRAMEVMNGTANRPAPTATEGVPAQIKPVDEMTTSQKAHISDVLAKQVTREQVSSNTSIDALVFDRPAPSEIIAAGSKGVINETSFAKIKEKIDKGIYVVCPDDGAEVTDVEKRVASQTNYNKILEAWNGDKMLDIHIGPMSTKPIGYIITKGSATGAGSASEQMKRERFLNFLVLDASGYIQATDGKPGAQIKYVEPKSIQTAKGPKTVDGHTIVVDKNKKEAIEAKAYVVSRKVTNELAEQACKSELAFRVKAYPVNSDGTPDTSDETAFTKKLIRVSLKASLPTTVRAAEYVEEFGTGERESNSDFKNPPTQEQLRKISEAHIKAINCLQRQANTDTLLKRQLGDKLKAFETTSAAPTAVM